MIKARRRPQEVVAIQFVATQECLEKIKGLLNKEVDPFYRNPEFNLATLRLDINDIRTIIREKDYILKDENDNIYVVTEKEFKNNYNILN